MGSMRFTFLILLLVLPAMSQSSAAEDRAAMSAVTGESWLTHLHRRFDQTSMGKTDRYGPAPGEDVSLPTLPAEAPTATVSLTGADLYRLNCRGCHGESGLGAPPEINSVINPVRSTAVSAIRERMKAVGSEIGRAEAEALAKQSKEALMKRLHEGGDRMPSFAHLNEAEIRSLYAYLRQLAGIKGAEHEQTSVREPALRVGELITKSTCHICHSAAGRNPDPKQILDGAIPPLGSLTLRTSRAEFIRKVTMGAPILMGAPSSFYRGRMPVFYYLRPSEASAAYLYLLLFPPAADPDVMAAANYLPKDFNSDLLPPRQAEETIRLTKNFEIKVTTLENGAILFVCVLIAGGLVVVVLQCWLITQRHEIEPVRRTHHDDAYASTDPHCVDFGRLEALPENEGGTAAAD